MYVLSLLDGQVQKVYAVTGILPGTSATATAYKISSVSASSCVLSFRIVKFFCINVTNWFTVNATNEAVQHNYLYRFCFGFYRQPSPAIYNDTGQAEPGLETCICAILALPVTDTDLAIGEGRRKSVVLGVTT